MKKISVQEKIERFAFGKPLSIQRWIVTIIAVFGPIYFSVSFAKYKDGEAPLWLWICFLINFCLFLYMNIRTLKGSSTYHDYTEIGQ